MTKENKINIGTMVVSIISSVVSGLILYNVAKADSVQQLWQNKIDGKADKTYVDSRDKEIKDDVDAVDFDLQEYKKARSEKDDDMHNKIIDIWKVLGCKEDKK